MIQFTKLRLSGFKSFVDKTELEIGPGLNGIVGPNGCGKSNLVEALRWVMGESSAKRMRGGGMEDVIFAGTNKRSARNLAEVSLLLNNSSRQAPAAYNSADEIEVTRKIEKDKGSGYKINGKNARARDVQMLFADTVTGANSPSLVSQGHVTRMINAKPHERRLILEESAGIAGLYARRHEAELRLKAADSNLVRVEDILGSMESRLSSLKRQARQASKYKNLSAQIRQLELTITYLEWLLIIEKQKTIKKDFERCESIVADKLITVTQLTKTQNTQAEDIPALRRSEAEAAATLQKHRLEFQHMEEEEKRHKNDLQNTKTQLHQTEIDKQREEGTIQETQELLKNIEEEHLSLIDEQKGEEETENAKKERKDEQEKQVIELEERYTSLKETAAENRAREDNLLKQIKASEDRLNILSSRKNIAEEKKQALEINENSQKDIRELEEKTAALDKQITEQRNQAEEKRQEIADYDDITAAKQKTFSETELEHTSFTAEINMLKRFFESDSDDKYTGVLDSITASPGFEKALSRALGDSLMASLDPHAPEFWQGSDVNSKELVGLPDGTTALLPNIDAPKELHAALSQIAVIENEEDCNNLQKQLKPGQSLVSLDGTYWRWDGYCVKSSAKDRHSVYLEQKNKLAELETKQNEVEAKLETAKESLDNAQQKHAEKKEEYENILQDIKKDESKLKELRPALQKIKEKSLRIESENKHYTTQIATYVEDIKEVTETLKFEKESHAALINNKDTNEYSEDAIDDLKQTLDHKKSELQETIREIDLFTQEQRTRKARIQAISDERISLKNRLIRSKEHVKELNTRLDTINEKMKQLAEKPISTIKGHEDILSKINHLEEQRNNAAENLAKQEHEISVTNKALKEAENILGQAREERASTHALLHAVNEQLKEKESNIHETLELKPQDIPNHAASDLVKYQTGDLPSLKQDKEKLSQERSSIGAVNLRADEEATELEKELTTLLHERNDLLQAIEELRSAINKINKEARERLHTAFDHVNAHFQRLFVQLFGGGKAHLKLIESEDPLGAGLEIFAQPPGKALQSLSLLSGGEQTLASIALIFGMFLTNPSPICVLDEIDAPLDDANVDRVCNLLDEIAEKGKTRFLIITHHRLSMARMDRLYGVTMAERGVSQLVSVDLQQSFDFIDKKVA